MSKWRGAVGPPRPVRLPGRRKRVDRLPVIQGTRRPKTLETSKADDAQGVTPPVRGKVRP